MTADLSRTLLRPVRDGNAFESTVERLAQAIRLGAFQPGDRLPPERELSEMLQVSRMTLREALSALRDAGLVATARGRAGGTYVLPTAARTGRAPAAAAPDRAAERVEDALAFRRVVEPGAAALAASRPLDEAERAHLLAGLDAVTDARDDGARRIADSRLHLAVTLLAGCDSLTAAVADVQVRLGELLAAIPVLRPNIAHSDDQHRAVVEAVLAGEPDTARRAMEDHCDATAALLRGLLT